VLPYQAGRRLHLARSCCRAEAHRTLTLRSCGLADGVPRRVISRENLALPVIRAKESPRPNRQENFPPAFSEDYSSWRMKERGCAHRVVPNAGGHLLGGLT